MKINITRRMYRLKKLADELGPASGATSESIWGAGATDGEPQRLTTDLPDPSTMYSPPEYTNEQIVEYLLGSGGKQVAWSQNKHFGFYAFGGPFWESHPNSPKSEDELRGWVLEMFTNTDPSKATIDSMMLADLVAAMRGSSRDQTVPANAYTPEYEEELRLAERQSPEAKMRRQIKYVQGEEKRWFMFLGLESEARGVELVCSLLGSDTRGWGCSHEAVASGNFFRETSEGAPPTLGGGADRTFRLELIKWQQAHGLEGDALLGERTARAMSAILYPENGHASGWGAALPQQGGESQQPRERTEGSINTNSLMKKISSERNYSIMRSGH